MFVITVIWSDWLTDFIFPPPISRHLNGSDMSNTSFWLRVALGSAVVAVLGFAIYRVVARLKWPTSSWVFFFCFVLFFFPRWRSIHQDQTWFTAATFWTRLECALIHFSCWRVYQIVLFCPTFSVKRLQKYKGCWKLVNILHPTLLCSALSALYCQSGSAGAGLPVLCTLIHKELFSLNVLKGALL